MKISPFFLAFFLYPLQAMAAPIWISNVVLVSPERLDQIVPGSVLIDQERIVRVERSPDARAPDNARVIDGQGYYLTPGLIDSHVHLQSIPGMSMEQPEQMTAMADAYYAQLPRSFLYFGYTSVIDLAVKDRSFINRVKQAPLHPDIYDCSAPLVMANGYPSNYAPLATRYRDFPNFIIDPAQPANIPAHFDPADYTPAKNVARIKADHGICVKTHFERGFGSARNLPVMRPAILAQVRVAASAQQLVLITHGNSLEAQQFAVDGGVDVLAHGLWHWGALNKATELPGEIRQLLDRVVVRGTGYQPTMQVLHGLNAYLDPAYLQQPVLGKLLPPAMLAWLATPAGQWFRQEVAGDDTDAQALQAMQAPLWRQRQVVAYLASKDANFVFGSDTPSSPTYGNIPGLNGYLEMQRLHEAGLSLAQVFKAATLNNARTFRLERDLGTIEAGKVANLLLMKISPLDDIKAYDSIDTVWVRGRPVRRDSLTVQDQAPARASAKDL
ncbi:MAG: amidohydrolase family protein [Duganella sp.]